MSFVGNLYLKIKNEDEASEQFQNVGNQSKNIVQTKNTENVSDNCKDINNDKKRND